MPRRSWIDLVWPVAGVDRSVGYQQQPPYTTPDALNVRTEDMAEYRERGGSRPGLGLALRTSLPGPVRLLTKVAVLRATWPYNHTPIYGSGLNGNVGDVTWGYPPSYFPSSSSFQGASSGLRADVNNGSFGGTWPVSYFDYRDSTLPYELSWFIRPSGDATMVGTATIHFAMADLENDVRVDSIEATLTLTTTGYAGSIKEWVGGTVVTSTASVGLTSDIGMPGMMTVRVVPATKSISLYYRRNLLGTITATALAGDQSAFEVVDANATIEVTKIKADYRWLSNVQRPYKDQRRNVLVAVSNGNIYLEKDSNALDLVLPSAVNSSAQLTAADREQKLFIADYGAAISGQASGTIATSGYNTLQDTGYDFGALGIDSNYVIQMTDSDYSQNEKQTVELFNCDGGDYRLGFRGAFTAPISQGAAGAAVQSALEAIGTIGASNVSVTGSGGGPHTVEFIGDLAGLDLELLSYQADGLTDSGGGLPSIEVASTQAGAGGEFVQGSYTISSVTGDTITFSPAISVAAGFVSDIGSVTYSVVRAPKVFDPKAESIVVHAASLGAVPAGCRLVCLYRDRIVYAASDLEPHVWYMSRQGDPYDWDYTAEDSGAAIFAQASVAGSLADPITAMIAHGDECLILGCYNSLWIVRGDPGYGGTVDQLSRKIGIVGSHAWCRTPDDMCVFLSPDGLYVMAAGCHGFPTSLSRERLPDDLLGIVPEREHVTMEYDTVHRGIHIFVSRYDSTQSAHWWFDWEAKAFWRVELQTGHDPFCLHERTAWDETPVVILGCRDGSIRYFDRDFQSDEGDNPIESYCCIGPFHLDRGGYLEGVLTGLDGSLGANSGAVNWELLVGDTAENAYRGTVRSSGTWSRQGVNFRSRPRARGVAAVLKVSNGSATKRWYLERITAAFTSAGQRRVR